MVLKGTMAVCVALPAGGKRVNEGINDKSRSMLR